LSNVFSLPHIWKPNLYICYPIDPELELLKPLLNGIKLDRYKNTAWISIVPSNTSVEFRLFGSKVVNITTKELQILVFASFGEKKGYIPLQVDFESKFLASMTNSFQHFPFGSQCAVMEMECTESSFVFSSKKNIGKKSSFFSVEAFKGDIFKDEEFRDFIFEDRNSIFGLSDTEGILENKIEGQQFGEVYEAKIGSLQSNYLKNISIGNMELEGYFPIVMWLDYRLGDVKLEKKLPDYLFKSINR